MGNKQKPFSGSQRKHQKIGRYLAYMRLLSRQRRSVTQNTFGIEGTSASVISQPDTICMNAETNACREIQNNIGEIVEKNPESENEDTLDIEIESNKNKENNKKPKGRRIIDVNFFFQKIKDVANHGLGCDINCLDLTSEKQTGFKSKFTFVCKMCNRKFFVENYSDECDLNSMAVAGTISIGCGQSQLQELAAALDLPLISASLFTSRQNLISKKWEEAAEESMTKAAEEEKALAIANGRLSPDGIPVIDVVADGCWSKRSYKNNYSSLSGAAAIVGRHTGKILYMGVKNKYCSICSQAFRKNVEAKAHTCYKNYDGPSTGMESA